ncbi:hypothetical protein ACLK1T_06665 [Escherichia coli]
MNFITTIKAGNFLNFCHDRSLKKRLSAIAVEPGGQGQMLELAQFTDSF